MSTIVHISADYPDCFKCNKTLAVQRLLELIPEHTPRVYSLNRINGMGGAEIIAESPSISTIVYRAPPYGLMLARYLAPVARLIENDLARRKVRPALIHAHKLTVEGIVADGLAASFDVPMICSVWGNTDQKVIASKPFLRSTFRAIADRASVLLPAAPWARDYVIKSLRVPAERFRILPVVSKLKPRLASPAVGDRIATLLHLDHFVGKNIPSLIGAVARLRRGGRPVELSIYGGGSEVSTCRLADRIRDAGCQEFVTLRGPLPHDRVQETLNRYAAFALPSRRETYGMVFIESLFAGVPILYPRGQSIDGYFDGVDVGRKCDARSVESIASGLGQLLENESGLKRNIATLHERGFFKSFEADGIARAYREVISKAASEVTARRPSQAQLESARR